MAGIDTNQQKPSLVANSIIYNVSQAKMAKRKVIFQKDLLQLLSCCFIFKHIQQPDKASKSSIKRVLASYSIFIGSYLLCPSCIELSFDVLLLLPCMFLLFWSSFFKSVCLCLLLKVSERRRNIKPDAKQLHGTLQLLRPARQTSLLALVL